MVEVYPPGSGLGKTISAIGVSDYITQERSFRSLDLTDFYSAYLPRTTPKFQQYLSGKWEFKQLEAGPDERLPYGKRGVFYNYQKFYHRFLRIYNELLIMDSPGVGKSCSVYGITEYIRYHRELLELGDPRADEKVAHIKRVIILVKGPTHRLESRNQLVCRCSNGYYETPLVVNAPSEPAQQSSLTKAIKGAGYTIITYGTFAKSLRKLTREQIIEQYSDSFIWIDEAHNLLIDPITDAGSKSREKTKNYATIKEFLHTIERSKKVLTSATPAINGAGEIGQLMNLILPLDGQIPRGYDFHNASDNDIRVLFPGADPNFIRNASEEEASRYYRGQIPDNFDFDAANIADVEPYYRGLIGFIRSSDAGTVRANKTNPNVVIPYQELGIQPPSLPVYVTMMSEHQRAGYLATLIGDHDLYASQRQASNFVFPDGYSGNGITEEERQAARRARAARKKAREAQEWQETYAATNNDPSNLLTEASSEDDNIMQFLLQQAVPLSMVADQPGNVRAFRRYVIVEKNGDFRATEEFKEALGWGLERELVLNRISYFGCKFGAIARIVTEAPGKWYIYGELHTGSGNIALGLCLEALGYTRFDDRSSIFQSTSVGKAKPICVGNEVTDFTSLVRSDVLPSDPYNPDPAKRIGYRYIILSQYTTDTQFKSALEAFNSRQNIHGVYIRGVMSSRVGRDGMNLNDVTVICLEGGEWNESGRFQAESRALRAVSHDGLLAEEQEKLHSEGRDPAEARVEVSIYNHAAATYQEVQAQQPDGSWVNQVNLASIDLRMYAVAGNKDTGIQHATSMMEACSINCQTFHRRNHRPDKPDYGCIYPTSPGECIAGCVDPLPTTIDYSTFDVYYSDEIVQQTIIETSHVFREYSEISFDELVVIMQSKITNFRLKYLILALEQMVSEAIQLTDRMGYISYLREDHGIFYLSHDYPDNSPADHSLAYYTSNHVSLTIPSLLDVAEDMTKTELSDMITQISNMDPNSVAFDQYMAGLSMSSEVELLEQCWLKKIAGETTPAIEAVLRRYQAMMFETPEPVQEINEERNQAWSGSKRGPKPKLDAPKRVEHIQQGKIDALWNHIQTHTPATETIYLHTLYSRTTNNTSYGFINRINKGEGITRLLKLSEGIGWRDVNTLEYKAYNTIIQVQIAKRLAPLESDPRMVYGIISEEKGREVFRLRLRYQEKEVAKSDGRCTYTGRECHTHDDNVLFDVMWRIKTPLPARIGVPDNYDYPTNEQMRQILINAILSSAYGAVKQEKGEAGELMNWSPEQVYFYYRWTTLPSRVTRKTKCKIIRSKMATENLLRHMTNTNNASTNFGGSSLVQINASGQIIPSPSNMQSPSPFFSYQNVAPAPIPVFAFPNLPTAASSAAPSFSFSTAAPSAAPSFSFPIAAPSAAPSFSFPNLPVSSATPFAAPSFSFQK